MTLKFRVKFFFIKSKTLQASKVEYWLVPDLMGLLGISYPFLVLTVEVPQDSRYVLACLFTSSPYMSSYLGKYVASSFIPRRQLHSRVCLVVDSDILHPSQITSSCMFYLKIEFWFLFGKSVFFHSLVCLDLLRVHSFAFQAYCTPCDMKLLKLL